MEGRSLVTIYVPDKLKIREYQRKLESDKKRRKNLPLRKSKRPINIYIL